MMPIGFSRVDDHRYRFVRKLQEGPQEVFINFAENVTPESYALTQQISQHLSENRSDLFETKKFYFQKGGRIFKLESEKTKKSQEIAKKLAVFFKFFSNSSKIDLKITEIPNNKKIALSEPVVNLPPTPKFEFPREAVPKSSYSAAAFSDGYTKIATEAFQKYERDFAAHDYSLIKSDHSQYCIVQNDGFLDLVPVKDYSPSEEGATLRNYRDFIIQEYGREKIDYVAFLYKIDLNANAPLTPEIVYRMNIGIGNIEKQELDALVGKLNNIASKNGMEGIFDQAWLSDFTTREVRGIKRLCSEQEGLPAQSITEWLVNYQSLSPGKKLKVALSILSCKPEERVRQFTGKEIVYPIKSKYTMGDSRFYKPWIDQQELLHTFSLIEEEGFVDSKRGNTWDAYCELLSHIVCKKHLARKHPTEEFRVGAVIPAPSDKSGSKRWYVVSACISNGKGIHSYTLEPLDSEDISLPAIKLFRSTSRSPYAIDNLSTIRNDFNPINAPGYEGAEFLKKYQDDFFKQRTIPLWVAYNVQAAKELAKTQEPLPGTIVNLKKSVAAYKHHITAVYLPKQMKEIVHTRDAELLQLAGDLIRKSIFNLFTVCRMIVIMFRYRGKIEVSPATQKSDMEFLLSLLKEEDIRFHGFKTDLQQRFQVTEETTKKMQKEQKRVARLERLLESGDYTVLSKLLDNLARQVGEHPDQKQKQSIIFTGHSLGGSCAQKFFVDYTAKACRLPLEGMEMSIKSFDPPAINTEDNVIYKSYGAHQSLFHDLNVKFSITHRIEAGDFVSQGGGEHLGAASDPIEQEDLQKWTHFEASVSQGLISSPFSDIRDSSTVHATRFERARRNPTFIINSAKNLLLQDGLDKKIKKRILAVLKKRLGDYERTWVDPQILWRFNHGDKRSWRHIQTVWQEPGLLSTSVERIRLFLGVVIRVFFARLSINTPAESLPDAGHGTWWKYRDVNGVFAVELGKGVTSLWREDEEIQ